MSVDDQRRLASFPWHYQLEEWAEQGVQLLIVRRGESRHPVVFVESGGVRYAIKETAPRIAEREIRSLREIELRGIPTLTAVGWVIVPASPIALDTPRIGGVTQYMSGDRGYTVTRLAPRVVPHSLLYRLPFSKRTTQSLLAAIAVLMIELHEHGVYWGDPSLANVLIRVDGRRILAIMADAETAELFPGPISEGLREQDLESFGESLTWQSEDLRQARNLPEETEVLAESDFHYFERRYHWLRKQHARLASASGYPTSYQVEQFLRIIHNWGYSLLGSTGHTLSQFATVLPGWYVKQLDKLLGIHVPRLYARRLYEMILGHQVLLIQRRGREVSLEEAARDWYTRYHLPTILLLRRHLARGQDPMQAYFGIMRHKWQLSKKAGYEVPLEEAILDWSMQQANERSLGEIDPAMMVKWWREREPVAEALEPPLIDSGELEPLLSSGEKPLVHLQQPELEQKLPEILENGQKSLD